MQPVSAQWTPPLRLAALIALGLLVWTVPTTAASAQSPPESKDTPRASHPNTLEEAFRELDWLLPADKIDEAFKRKPELEAVSTAPVGFVVFIRDEWFRSGHSALRDHLYALGVRHSDCAFVVLGAYWQHLNGKPIAIERYIAGGPHTLEEAFQELDRSLPADHKEIFKRRAENRAVARTHLGLGLNIRNQWFRSGRASALAGYLQSLGAGNFEDMSGMVLTSYWRYLNGKPIEIEKQGARFADYRANPEKLVEELREAQRRLIELDKEWRYLTWP